MKAIAFTKYGSPDFLELKEVEKPAPKENEVLVKVIAASVNSWDWELLNGVPFVNRLMFGLFRPKKIKFLGCDIAGQVEAVGKKVRAFQPGDEVFGDLSSHGWNGFAEYVSAPEVALTQKPEKISFHYAASMPQASLLAWQGLNFNGPIRSGQKVLINGAGGGAGTFAVQIAKSIGAEVTGVDHGCKLDMLRDLGADHVMDYEKEDYTKCGETYDLILDCVVNRSISDYKRVLKTGGAFAIIGGENGPITKMMLMSWWTSKTTSYKMGLMMHKANEGLAEMAALVEEGTVKPIIDRCYPLADVPEALRYFGEGKVKGKLVITMSHDDKGS